MKSKVRLFRPFHFLVLCILIIIVSLISILKIGLEIYNITIIILCFGYITNWQVVRVFKNRFEFYRNFLFIKYRKYSIEIADLDELFLIKNTDAMVFEPSSTSSAGGKIDGATQINYLLVAKNLQRQLIFVIRTMHYDKVSMISKLFSDYYDIPILKKIYFGDLSDKEFVNGEIINDLIEEKRLKDYKKWRDFSFSN